MTQTGRIYSIFVHVLGFFLLWEWLRPLDKITDTIGIHYFVIFTAIALFVNFLIKNKWLSFLTKAIVMFAYLAALFKKEDMTWTEWIVALFKDIYENMKLLFQGDVFDLTPLFRTFLFFILLWMVTYLLRYWLLVNKNIFVFYFMTIVYVTVLDTFTKYNGEWAIVRIVFIGFLLLSLLFLQRLLSKEKITIFKSIYRKWVVPFIVLLTLSTFVAYLTPKAGPIWPDPVPFLQSQADNVFPRKSGGIAKIGYGENDTLLGGPFLPDDTTVFEVITSSRQYWRVETKDVYTGKGWLTSQEPLPGHYYYVGDQLQIDFSPSTGEIEKAKIYMKMDYSHIVIPYGVESIYTTEDVYFRHIPALEKLLIYEEENIRTSLREYEIYYRDVEFNIDEMRKIQSMPIESGFDYENFYQRYIQLPESLPQRVRELAFEITAEYTNWYDKAKAIEQFFRNGDFVYETTDVAVPGPNDDYVDQFLFETKKGYCDNFSTAMVVLLRAVGIPARWAKGYAPGNYIGMIDPENILYEVTNNEAHSWVEVYFPGIGWVPFEPTIGFANPTNFVYDESDDSEDSESSTNPGENQDDMNPNIPELIENEFPELDSPVYNPGANNRSVSWKLIIISGMGILLVGGILYRTRTRWIAYYLLWKYRNKENQEHFISAYEQLLKQLERFGLKREGHQTLRDYALMVDQYFQTDEMSTLTINYERFIYRGDGELTVEEKIKNLWKNLIKRSVS